MQIQSSSGIAALMLLAHFAACSQEACALDETRQRHDKACTPLRDVSTLRCIEVATGGRVESVLSQVSDGAKTYLLSRGGNTYSFTIDAERKTVGQTLDLLSKDVEVDLRGVCSSASAPPSPLLRPFGDNKHWILAEPMVYSIGATNQKIRVPKGFVTDFASIPQPLWSLGLSPHGQYSRAAVVHDYLYWTQVCTRKQSDRLLLIAMKESDTFFLEEVAVYQGVDKGGQSSWDNNTKERDLQLPRVVPQQYLRPSDPNTTWPKYRTILVAAGVKDPQFASNPPFCQFGNSTSVP